MCSQPIVHEAHDFRATFGDGPRSCPASRSAPSKWPDWKFLVGRASKRLKASRLATVPSSRYFSVAGPNERAERSRASSTVRLGSARGRPPVPPDGDGLDLLRAHHRAQAASAGVSAVVADRGEGDQPLARRADRGDLPAGAVLAGGCGPRPRRPRGPRGRRPVGTRREASRRRCRRRRRRSARRRPPRGRWRRPRSAWRRSRSATSRGRRRPDRSAGRSRRRRTWPRSSAGCRPAG